MTSGYAMFGSEHERRLFEMGTGCIYAIDQDRVNLDDLIHCMDRPGGIVRCDGNPSECIKVVTVFGGDSLGCVAGWISEDE